jgi:hypothetical protein
MATLSHPQRYTLISLTIAFVVWAVAQMDPQATSAKITNPGAITSKMSGITFSNLVAWGFLLVFFTAGADIPGVQDVTQALAVLLVMSVLVMYGPHLMTAIKSLTTTIDPATKILPTTPATPVVIPKVSATP